MTDALSFSAVSISFFLMNRHHTWCTTTKTTVIQRCTGGSRRSSRASSSSTQQVALLDAAAPKQGWPKVGHAFAAPPPPAGKVSSSAYSAFRTRHRAGQSRGFAAPPLSSQKPPSEDRRMALLTSCTRGHSATCSPAARPGAHRPYCWVVLSVPCGSATA